MTTNQAQQLDVFIDRELMKTWYLASESAIVSIGEDGKAMDNSEIAGVLDSMTPEQHALPEVQILTMLYMMHPPLFLAYIGQIYNLIEDINE